MKEKRRLFLGQLINIIQTRVQHTFASAVRMEDYRKVDTDYHLSDFSRPYALAECTCIARIARWWQKWDHKADDSIALVFEHGDTDQGDLRRAVKKHFVAGINFLTKKECAQFQAADLLAYEHLKVNKLLSERGEEQLFENELRQSLRKLSEIPGARNGADWGVHLEDDMRESCIRERIPLRKRS